MHGKGGLKISFVRSNFICGYIYTHGLLQRISIFWCTIECILGRQKKSIESPPRYSTCKHGTWVSHNENTISSRARVTTNLSMLTMTSEELTSPPSLRSPKGSLISLESALGYYGGLLKCKEKPHSQVTAVVEILSG